MIPYSKQDIHQDDIKAVTEVLGSDYLTQGPKIEEFEKKFSAYVGAKYAVAVSNGTGALHLACIAMGVNPESTVLTSSMTFVASANCVLYCGGNVQFIDIDNNILLDLDKLEALLSESIKGTFQGVIPVHFSGACIDMQRLKKICNEFDLWIIEDACHAPGGYFIDSDENIQLIGNGKFADISVFSLHPVKHFTSGEGGILTTDSRQVYEQLLRLRSHGITKKTRELHEDHGGWYYEMQNLGFNYRLTDIQCALGISQLQRADASLKARKRIAKKYDQYFDEIGIKTLPRSTGHAYHLYIILVEQRKALYDYLREQGIYAQVHYIPVHYQPYYKKLGWKKGDFPKAEEYYEQCISLPMYPSLTSQEQKYITQQIKSFYD